MMMMRGRMQPQTPHHHSVFQGHHQQSIHSQHQLHPGQQVVGPGQRSFSSSEEERSTPECASDDHDDREHHGKSFFFIYIFFF